MEFTLQSSSFLLFPFHQDIDLRRCTGGTFSDVIHSSILRYTLILFDSLADLNISDFSLMLDIMRIWKKERITQEINSIRRKKIRTNPFFDKSVWICCYLEIYSKKLNLRHVLVTPFTSHFSAWHIHISWDERERLTSKQSICLFLSCMAQCILVYIESRYAESSSFAKFLFQFSKFPLSEIDENKKKNFMKIKFISWTR